MWIYIFLAVVFVIGLYLSIKIVLWYQDTEKFLQDFIEERERDEQRNND